jgi:excisionase family DNA binding protein
MARDRRSNPPAARDFTRRLSDRTLPSDPAWLTVSQLCGRWQLNRKTVYKFIVAKALPAWKVGSHLYRVAVSDVLRFEVRNKLTTSGTATASRDRRRIN